jgi:hypothetical protein
MVKKIDCWEYKEGGEEFKVPHYTSAVVTRDYITIYNIVPILVTLLLWLLYKYCLTSVTNINSPYLLLLLQYIPKFAKENGGGPSSKS